MNQYNTILKKQLAPWFLLFLLLLFNLCFASTLVAQNQDTTKVKPKKTQPDGEMSRFPNFPMDGLLGRLKKIPHIEDNSDISGRIVMALCVNKKGKVVSANYVRTKSTISDAALIEKVTQKAKECRFSRTKKKGEDCGEITFRFIVQ